MPNAHTPATRSAYRFLMCLLLLMPAMNGSAGDRPNLVVIMADDMGWGDVDFPVKIGHSDKGEPVMYPGTKLWRTPHLRAMAENGLVFSRMYSQAPTCSPTRASVLTGRAPQRMGIPFANKGRLENREVSMAEYAQSLGYRTGHFGKWHLGVFTRNIKDANRGGKNNSHQHYATPLNSGFDVQYSTESKTSTYDPGTSGLTTATRYWTGPGQFVPLDDPQLKGDDSAIIAREAMAFMEQSAKSDQPFLAVVWFHTPHKPLNTPGNKQVDTLEAYRFAIQDMDTAVGRIRAKLRELGVADNTVVTFTSDNGPEDDQDYDNSDLLRANKRELYEGGVRVPGLIEWPARIKPGVTHTPMVTTDYLPTLMELWGIEPVDDRPLDGQSLAKTILSDRGAPRTKAVIFNSSRHQSILSPDNGRYKLISTDRGKSWSLYDIVTDYDENEPLATTDTLNSAKPNIRALYESLLKQYNNWAESVEQSLSNRISGDYDTRITSSKGAQLLAEPPHSLKQGEVKTKTPHVYLERQHATLRSPIAADGKQLKPGTVVNSFLVHADSPDGIATAHTVTITFKDPILAVITATDQLQATDELSFADPTFDGRAARGLEKDDKWSVSADGLTVQFTLTSGALDQARVLTRSTLNR